jgi:hypothetical protein
LRGRDRSRETRHDVTATGRTRNASSTAAGAPAPALFRRGLRLEYATLSWNVVGSGLVLFAAVDAMSVAMAGFGLDSLIEIGASTVVVWQLRGVDKNRERHAIRLIGLAFVFLALYVMAQTTYTFASGFHPHSSRLGIAWLALTVLVMLALAAAKARTGSGARKCRPPNRSEGYLGRRLSRSCRPGRASLQRPEWVVVGGSCLRDGHRRLRRARGHRRVG